MGRVHVAVLSALVVACSAARLVSIDPVDTWARQRARDSIEASLVSEHGSLVYDPACFDVEDVKDAVAERHRWSRFLDAGVEHLVTLYNTSQIQGWPRFEALGPMGPRCRKMEKYGNGDSEKRACGLSASMSAVGCKVLSIGSNNEWNFEEEVVRLTNCTVETFDCTGGGKNWSVPEAIRDRVRLHEVCLSKNSSTIGDRQYVTYKEMLAIASVDEFPAYLKMDIEGWEYDVLRSMVESGEKLPNQIAFELHYGNWDTSNEGMSWAKRDKRADELALFMDYLWRFGHYYVVDRRDNGSCSVCSELLLVRIARQSA